MFVQIKRNRLVAHFDSMDPWDPPGILDRRKADKMLDKLPLVVSQVVISQWLPLFAIVRLETACAGAVNRREWLELFDGCPTQVAFITPSRSALAAMRWVSSRQMKFSHYVIRVTKRNKVQRIGYISDVRDSVVRLSIEQTHDPIRGNSAVINQPPKQWTFTSWILSNFIHHPSDAVVEYPRGNNYEHPAEDTDESFPNLLLPNLQVLSVEGSCFNHLQWLPVAPNLLQLQAGSVSIDCTTFEAIATRFPKLQHLAILLTHYLTEETVQKHAAQICSSLKSLNVSDQFANSALHGYARHLLPHCGRLQYLALYGFSINDGVCETIATHCHQLLGLDIGEGHQITGVGLQALATSCSTLHSLGLSFSRMFEPPMKDAWDALILTNFSTLQRIALVIGGRAAPGAAKLDLTLAPAECTQLRSLQLGMLTAHHAPGLLRMLGRCENLQQLCLAWLGNVEITPWHMELKAQIAAQYPHLILRSTQQRDYPIWARDTGVNDVQRMPNR